MKITYTFTIFMLLFYSILGEPVFAIDTKKRSQSVSVNGFRAEWKFEGSDLLFEISAPTTGWVALGFNPQNDIVKTNLIMGAITHGRPRLEDRFVVGFGNHQAVEQIGGTSSISLLYAEENNEMTVFRFRIPQQAKDKFHYDLTSGSRYYFICAYSESDDFQHHSIMRKHIAVTL